jgi:hypothetical protein
MGKYFGGYARVYLLLFLAFSTDVANFWFPALHMYWLLLLVMAPVALMAEPVVYSLLLWREVRARDKRRAAL